MSAKTVRRFVMPLGLGGFLVWLVVFGLSTVRAHVRMQQAPSIVAAANRAQDPVVVTGANFPGFSSVPVDQLVVYAYQSGVWTPVPFQIDEVNITGTYVISDDGLLDANDELVFMLGDAGEGVSTTVWPDDQESRLHSRYVISVTNAPRLAHAAWVYLFRSTTLPRSSIQYISWDQPTQTATTISYTAAFSPSAFVGLADLMINDSDVDILDRQKVRAEIFLGLIKLNEEDLATLNPAPLNLPAVGPVRAVANDGDLNAAVYGSRVEFNVSFDLSDLGPFLPDFIRTSFDWKDPAVTSIITYHDSNTAVGVSIDGLADMVPTTPPVDWIQVNGDANGPGGVVMAMLSVDTGGGTLSNYYKDDSVINMDDTGDQRSYGDAGMRIDGPGAIVDAKLVAFILPSGTTANVGAAVFERANNPLTASAAEQRIAAPDLTIIKDDGGTTATPGGLITYTLTYTNNGTRDASSVVITEAVPINASIYTATPSGWQPVGATNGYTFNAGDLRIGANRTITFVVAVTHALPAGVHAITNTAQIGDDGANGRDANLIDNETQISTAVTDDQAPEVIIYLPLIMNACACP